MSKEPEYLKRLRASRSQAKASVGAGRGGRDDGYSVQEQEALRWARETAGKDLRSVKDLEGARYAALLKVQSATGETLFSLEGLPSREALIQRLMPDAGLGEEVLSGYEVRGGRPITIEVVGGEVKLRMGEPRPGANPVSPEKMLRMARSQAAQRAKTRPRDDGGRRGGGGRGR